MPEGCLLVEEGGCSVRQDGGGEQVRVAVPLPRLLRELFAEPPEQCHHLGLTAGEVEYGAR